MYGEAVMVQVVSRGQLDATIELDGPGLDHTDRGGAAPGDVVGPVATADLLAAVRTAHAESRDVAVHVPATAASPAALVTALVMAGARCLVLPDVVEDPDGFAVEVRRAADVTVALLVERGGSPP